MTLVEVGDQAGVSRLPAQQLPGLVAGLAAELGVRALYDAFGRWADPASDQTLTDLTRQALGELRAAMATLA